MSELIETNYSFLLFQGENINIAWAPDGKTIAVGNKEDLVSFIDVRSHKIKREEQFKFEVYLIGTFIFGLNPSI